MTTSARKAATLRQALEAVERRFVQGQAARLAAGLQAGRALPGLRQHRAPVRRPTSDEPPPEETVLAGRAPAARPGRAGRAAAGGGAGARRGAAEGAGAEGRPGPTSIWVTRPWRSRIRSRPQRRRRRRSCARSGLWRPGWRERQRRWRRRASDRGRWRPSISVRLPMRSGWTRKRAVAAAKAATLADRLPEQLRGAADSATAERRRRSLLATAQGRLELLARALQAAEFGRTRGRGPLRRGSEQAPNGDHGGRGRDGGPCACRDTLGGRGARGRLPRPRRLPVSPARPGGARRAGGFGQVRARAAPQRRGPCRTLPRRGGGHRAARPCHAAGGRSGGRTRVGRGAGSDRRPAEGGARSQGPR